MNIDPAVVRDMFAGHYFLLAFLASLGTIQVSVTISGVRGLWLTPHRALTRWLGIALIIASFLIFFVQPVWTDGPWAAGSVVSDSAGREWGRASWAELAGARSVNDIHGGLDGPDQATWFPLAAVVAFAVSALVGAVNLRFFQSAESRAGLTSQDDPVTGGLAGLASRSYFSNLPVSWQVFRSEVVSDWNTEFASADRWSLFRMIFRRSQTRKSQAKKSPARKSHK